ncbi:MAG: hypothetical protein ACTSYO_01710, partial [Candidatus Ranarchaeia archaeon]
MAAYKPSDTGYAASKQLVNNDDVTKIGSAVLINELFSVTFRLYQAAQITVPSHVEKVLSRLSTEKRVYAIINAMLLDWQLVFPSFGYD